MVNMIFFTLSLLVLFSHSVDPVEIKPGVAVVRGMECSEFANFFVNLDNMFLNVTDTDYISIVVTPLSGDVDLLVSIQADGDYPDDDYCNQSEDNCFNSNHVYGEVVIFLKTDPQVALHYVKGTVNELKIRVFCPSTDLYQDVLFSANIFTQLTQIPLENGIPQIANNFELDMSYFKFRQEKPETLTVSVTPMAGKGDPDIFVSAKVLRPNRDTPIEDRWYENNVDYDVIECDKDDPKYVSPATWGVGVHSIFREEFLYTVVYSSNDNYTTLMEGVPLGYRTRKGEYQYYKFYLPKIVSGNGGLYILVYNRYSSGDPDVYITGPSRGEEPKPSVGNYEWDSSDRGSDFILIKNALEGWYKISVRGYEDSHFKIIAIIEKSIIRISDRNPPLYVNVESGKYKYFKFSNIYEENNIYILISPVYGYIESYVSLPSSYNPRPTSEEGKYDQKAKGDGNYRYYYFKKKTESPGDYYFSVYGMTNSNFSVSVITNQTHTILRNGEEIIFNSVPKAAYKYYIFDKDDTVKGPFAVTTVPHTGDVSIYVSTTDKYPGDTSDHKKYDWKSTNYKTDTVTVYSDDTKVKGNRYFIGVKGSKYYQSNYFSIIAYSSDKEIELYDGQYLGGNVKINKRINYKFYLHAHSSITITLTKSAQNDDCKFYVNHNHPSPSKYDHDYESISNMNEYVNVINAQVGTYYIGVEGNSLGPGHDSIYFDIIYTSNYRYVYSNRDASLVITQKGTIEQIHTHIGSDVDYVVVSTALISGSTSLYVSTNGSSTGIGPHQYTWKTSGWPGNVLLIPSNDIHYNKGDWAIGIEAHEFSNYLLSVDTIPAVGLGSLIVENMPNLLRLPRCLHIPCTTHMKYYFQIGVNIESPAPENYFVSITMREGSAGVYISQDWNQDPGRDTPLTWKSEGIEDRVITLSKEGVPQLKDGWVFISVYGIDAKNETELEINFFKQSSPQLINQDQMVITRMESKFPIYYTVMAVKSAKEESIPTFVYVESCDIYEVPQFFLNVQTREKEADKHPTKDKHDIASGVGNKTREVGIVSQFIEIKDITHPELYFIAIEANDSVILSFFVTAIGDSRPSLPALSLKHGADFDYRFNLHIPIAKASVRFPDRMLTYKIYMKQIYINPNGIPEKVNFKSVCAIELYGKFITSFDQNYSRKKTEGNVEYFEFPLIINPNNVYKINIVVNDGFGLKQSYNEMWLIYGHASDHWNYIIPIWDVWYTGWIFIFLFLFGILLCFVIGITLILSGVICKFHKKKRFQIQESHKKEMEEHHKKDIEKHHKKDIEEHHKKDIEKPHKKDIEKRPKKEIGEGNKKEIEDRHKKEIGDGNKGVSEPRKVSYATNFLRDFFSSISPRFLSHLPLLVILIYFFIILFFFNCNSTPTFWGVQFPNTLPYSSTPSNTTCHVNEIEMKKLGVNFSGIIGGIIITIIIGVALLCDIIIRYIFTFRNISSGSSGMTLFVINMICEIAFISGVCVMVEQPIRCFVSVKSIFDGLFLNLIWYKLFFSGFVILFSILGQYIIYYITKKLFLINTKLSYVIICHEDLKKDDVEYYKFDIKLYNDFSLGFLSSIGKSWNGKFLKQVHLYQMRNESIEKRVKCIISDLNGTKGKEVKVLNNDANWFVWLNKKEFIGKKKISISVRNDNGKGWIDITNSPLCCYISNDALKVL